jgi:hypothetical protein
MTKKINMNRCKEDIIRAIMNLPFCSFHYEMVHIGLKTLPKTRLIKYYEVLKNV